MANVEAAIKEAEDYTATISDYIESHDIGDTEPD
jgi:hypothetical protein